MSDSARDLLVRGIAAAKAKDKDQARFYLEWVLRTDANRQQKIKAWLWLSEVSDDPAERRECLENVLAYDPTNPLARRGIAILRGQLDPDEIIDPNRQPTPSADTAPQPARTKRFICQQCGGKLTFSPDGQSLSCAYCDRQLTLYQAIEEGAMVKEQDFVVALATARGHTHPVGMRSFDCQACGVSFVLGPDVLSLTCPYCASAYVVQATETRDLIPPEGIIPFAVTREEAYSALGRWLEEKGLRAEAQATPPDGLYLPAWTFDVGGEVQWRGKVLGSRPDPALGGGLGLMMHLTDKALDSYYGQASKAVQTGSYPIFYDDVLVPASHTLSADLAQELNHFRLDGVVPYDAGYLADWPTEVYQISVSDASLAARRQAWERARRMAGIRAKMGEIRNVTFSSAGIIIESFKLILLPIWLTHYRCQVEDFQVVINGQTGNVRGERPHGGFGKWMASLWGEG